MTDGRNEPGEEATPSEVTPQPGPPPDAPPSEPPTIGWVTGVQWEPVGSEPQVPQRVWARLEVGSVFGRTLDTFAGRWLFFVALAVPSAFASALGVYLSSTRNVGLILLEFVVTYAIGVVFSLAIMVATDDARGGRAATFGTVIGRAAGRAVPVALSALAEFVALVGLILVAGVCVGLASTAGGVGLLAAIIVTVFAIILFVIVGLRWLLSQPAIAFDGLGPLQGLNRSWAVTRGNLWRLFGLFLLLSLLLLPFSIGLGALSISADDRALAMILTALSSLVITPLYAIALATTYGDLTGRPAAEQVPGRGGSGRIILVGGILAFGLVALVIGVPKIGPAINNLALAQVPAADRGKIEAGTARDPSNLCHPSGIQTTFSTADTIYVGGFFTKPIQAGDTGTIYIFVDGTLANSAPLTDPTRPVACYYELDPIVGARPATYRLLVSYGGETIAEGQFIVR